jgi:hypothetical protein
VACHLPTAQDAIVATGIPPPHAYPGRD